jgi:endoglucanase
LIAWRWSPNDVPAVKDLNNATDGDLFVAWALYRASILWDNPDYLKDAIEILRALRPAVGRTWQGLQILLPGEKGFILKEGFIINLSYWLFPALKEFERIDPENGFWREVVAAGLTLSQKARFGHWNLPSDWILLTDSSGPAPGFPPRFGYDAIRIPLYLAWSGQTEANLESFVSFWHSRSSYLPAWYDLNLDVEDGRGGSPGMHAVRALVMALATGHPAESKANFPSDDYYSSTLRLLSQVAWMEVRS